MKLEINKEKLSKAINKAEKISTKNSTLPALACLFFEFKNGILFLKATNIDLNLTIQIKAKGDMNGSFIIPASTINSFISNLPKNDHFVFFEVKNGNLHITTESTDTIIKTQAVEDFPVIEDKKNDKKFSLSSVDFIKGLNSVWYSAAVSSIKPELSSVYIHSDGDDLVFVATDSFRLAEYRLKAKNSENFDSVLVPYKNVVEIIRIFSETDSDIDLYFVEDRLIIESDDILLSSRIIEGSFPDYKQIIPKEIKTEVTVLKEDLIQAIRITSIFSDKFNQINFYIMPEDKIFSMTSPSNDVGETKNSIKSKMEGENIKINFNSKYINDCLSSIKSDSLVMKFHGSEKPMIIQGTTDRNFMYLVSNISNR